MGSHNNPPDNKPGASLIAPNMMPVAATLRQRLAARFNPPLSETHYAEFDHSKITSFVPGIEAAFPDRNNLNVQEACRIIDHTLDNLHEQVAQAEVLLEAFSLNPTPVKMKAFLDVMMPVQEMQQNIGFFPRVIMLYCDAGVTGAQTQALASHVMEKMAGEKNTDMLQPILAKFDEKQRNLFLRAPKLKEYRNLLNYTFKSEFRTDPKTSHDYVQEFMRHAGAIEAQKEAYESIDRGDVAAQQQAEVNILEHQIRANIAKAKSANFETTFGQADTYFGVKQEELHHLFNALAEFHKETRSPIFSGVKFPDHDDDMPESQRLKRRYLRAFLYG